MSAPASEWLVTNGLGGFASAQVDGSLSRRYHGHLVAALPAPLGRVVMLSGVSEQAILADGTFISLGDTGSEFTMERGLPVWTYAVAAYRLEKRVVMPHGQNTVHLLYRLLAGDRPLELRLEPTIAFRRLEDAVSVPLGSYAVSHVAQRRCEIAGDVRMPVLRIACSGDMFDGGEHVADHMYAMEAARGYDSHGQLWSPGPIRLSAEPGQDASLVASTESWDSLLALTGADAVAAEARRRDRLVTITASRARMPAVGETSAAPGEDEAAAAALVLAADQFLVTPAGRVAESARVHAAGDEVCTVIAGYHWFSDWGRDTMISLEGLALVSGRHREAGSILRTFAKYVRRGLIPNMFPEGDVDGLYNTADATLWFVHALHRYVNATGDRRTLRDLLPLLHEIVDAHVRGTDFNIAMDPADGLLRQGEERYALTWMDAKVGDWVVTPRRGKAVEIQALWYNALRLIEGWTADEHGSPAASHYGALADTVRASFNARFWFAQGGHLYDVVDGPGAADDPSCRPNQLFALSLEHPVLDRGRWAAVLQVVTERLLTPVGLRSLAPGSADYRPSYDGDLRSRDAAYHQGTVWGWLIGPYIDAWIRVHGVTAAARPLLDGLIASLGEAGIGQLSEIFDAQAPYSPRGCIAQAWTVAEVLRCLHRTAAR
jgi:predicted glycogen debranching enzyme